MTVHHNIPLQYVGLTHHIVTNANVTPKGVQPVERVQLSSSMLHNIESRRKISHFLNTIIIIMYEIFHSNVSSFACKIHAVKPV